jgi:hypothetical protein
VVHLGLHNTKERHKKKKEKKEHNSISGLLIVGPKSNITEKKKKKTDTLVRKYLPVGFILFVLIYNMPLFTYWVTCVHIIFAPLAFFFFFF